MSYIEVVREGAIQVITINRPSAKNALSLQMYERLTSALAELDHNEQLKVAVIYGADGCFTAGNDLKDFLSGGKLDNDHPTVQFLHQINQTRKPIVAAVNGAAIGIGTTMLLHCDYVVASTNSIFQLPFARLGVCPELASSLLLPQLVGYQKSFEWLVLGDSFSTEEALQANLINKVTDSETAYDEAMIVAEKLALLPSQSVLASKSLLKSAVRKRATQVIQDELALFSDLLESDETKTIIGQFFARK